MFGCLHGGNIRKEMNVRHSLKETLRIIAALDWEAMLELVPELRSIYSEPSDFGTALICDFTQAVLKENSSWHDFLSGKRT